MNKFWQFKNDVGADEAELVIYGVLAEETWFGDEVTPKMFSDELLALGNVSKIKVRLNSPGGDLFAGTTIHNMLRDHSANVTAYIDGLAASAASIVAMAADTVVMPPSAMMMIHNPATIAWGDAREMRATAEVLDKVRDSMIEAYQEKTGIERSQIINMLNSETWMSAKEAVELGFADEIDSQTEVTASLKGKMMIINGLGFDLDKYPSLPARLLYNAATAEGDPEPTPEQDTEPTAEPTPEQDDEPMTEPTTEPVDETEAEADDTDPVIADRARVAVLLAIQSKVPGSDEIIRNAITNGDDPRDVALKLVMDDAVKNAALLEAKRRDAPNAMAPETDIDDSTGGVVQKMIDKFNEIRGVK